MHRQDSHGGHADGSPPLPGPTAIPPARHIELDPADWFLATWRDLPPLRRPAPAPFDLDNCLARLRRVKLGHRGGVADWDDVPIAPALTRAEALFWLWATTGVGAGSGARSAWG